MRATIKRYSRSPLVHAIIVALAVAIGIVVALTARRTRGDDGANCLVACAQSQQLS
jgi:hypothetical protein